MGQQNCVRFFLVAVTIIFLLAGLAILGLGIWVQVEKGDYVALADSDTGLTGAILIIAVGAVTAVLFFIGLFGAIKRNRIALWIFFSILAILFILQVVALVFGMVYQNKLEDELEDDMMKSINEYAGEGNSGLTDAWDWAQQKFECCGVHDYKSWQRSYTDFNKNGSHFLVPDSCCKTEASGCGKLPGRYTPSQSPNTTAIYTEGCFPEVKDYIKDHLLTIGLGALGFLVIQLIVMILTLILVLSLGKHS